MAAEIERKFLIVDDSWRAGSEAVSIAQGYLSRDVDRTVRVRIADLRAWVTVKGRSEGIRRAEFEFEVPVTEARDMLALCLPGVIEKDRYRVTYGGHVWEIDVFHGENEGLVMAEVELEDEGDEPPLPPWVGDEVSSDPRYFNSYLSRVPFTRWGEMSQA